MAEDALESFPRPGVAVDIALLTVCGAAGPNPALRILVQERMSPPGRALPGAFIRERKTVAETVDDLFARKIRIEPGTGTTPRLLRLFDDPLRDTRSWVISAAYSVSMGESDLAGAHADLVDIRDDGVLDSEGPLLFDHDQIVAAAVADVRDRYEFRHRYADTYPDPDGFLQEPFTMLQLRRVHEAVIGSPLHKDNFNRRMKPFLEPLLQDGRPLLADNQRGRPAALYWRAPRESAPESL